MLSVVAQMVRPEFTIPILVAVAILMIGGGFVVNRADRKKGNQWNR
jgi:hypothetical protein